MYSHYYIKVITPMPKEKSLYIQRQEKETITKSWLNRNWKFQSCSFHLVMTLHRLPKYHPNKNAAAKPCNFHEFLL